MILQSLYALYDRLIKESGYKIASYGYSLQKISFVLVITKDGNLHNIVNMREKTNGKEVPRKLLVPGGDKPTGRVTEESVHKKVQLLRNDLPYILGWKIMEETDLESGHNKKYFKPAIIEFEAFKKYHLSLEDQIKDDDFSSVCLFLRKWNPRNIVEKPEWTEIANGQGMFQLLGKTQFIHEREAIKNWWDSQQLFNPAGDSFYSQCLISGSFSAIARLHEPKIKRVKYAQPSGAPIVSFDMDNDAFSSYGRDKQQGYNAPVSVEATFRYATALNSLLDGPKSYKHRMELGETTLVFWTDKPSIIEDVFFQIAEGESVYENSPDVQDEGIRQKLEVFLNALRIGRKAYIELNQDPDETAFYLLGLTGQAKGRIGVRFYYSNTLSELLDNLQKHFNDIKITPQWRQNSKNPDPEFPSFKQILEQTKPIKEKKAKAPPILAGPLLRSVIEGHKYSDGLYSAVMRQIQANRNINYFQASFIKGYLKRNLRKEISVSLDEEKKDPSYRLGRLFAVLVKTQSDALVKVNASIRDRFYSSASATPRAVFPLLLRTYQHHLAKLEVRLKLDREKTIQEIIGLLDNFPAHLNLTEQGMFAIGYYHQMQNFYIKKTRKN